MKKIADQPATALALYIFLGLGLSFWIARAPTIFSGKMPIIGDKFPIELTATYLIILVPPICAALCAGLFLLVKSYRGAVTPMLLSEEKSEFILLKIVFGLVFLSSAALSLQYFVILAPENLCPTRPHYDFLWTNVPGPERIFHCMSNTDSINAKGPYYIQPQILQSWGHVLWPALTLYFLICASRAWSKATKL